MDLSGMRDVASPSTAATARVVAATIRMIRPLPCSTSPHPSAPRSGRSACSPCSSPSRCDAAGPRATPHHLHRLRPDRRRHLFLIGAVFLWLFRPIGKITEYARAIERGERPPKPNIGIGREVNTLAMRARLDARLAREPQIRRTLRPDAHPRDEKPARRHPRRGRTARRGHAGGTAANASSKTSSPRPPAANGSSTACSNSPPSKAASRSTPHKHVISATSAGGFRDGDAALGEDGFFLAWAVSSSPPTMAPAWPMRRPGGAVAPAMNPAMGFLQFSLAQRAASTSAHCRRFRRS
jgi:hypothetical protein